MASHDKPAKLCTSYTEPCDAITFATRRKDAIAASAKAAAPGPGPARDGILDKLLSSDAMLLFAVDGVCPELVNGRVAMFGFFTALIKELVTGQSFTTQLVRPCRGVVARRAATCHVDSQQQPTAR